VSHYKSNLRDIEFNLFEVLARDEVLGTGPFSDLDTDTARAILSEVDRLAREEIAASFEDADRNPPVFDPSTSSVAMNPRFAKSYQAFMEAEWYRLQLPAELGGQSAPATLNWSFGSGRDCTATRNPRSDQPILNGQRDPGPACGGRPVHAW